MPKDPFQIAREAKAEKLSVAKNLLEQELEKQGRTDVRVIVRETGLVVELLPEHKPRM